MDKTEFIVLDDKPLSVLAVNIYPEKTNVLEPADPCFGKHIIHLQLLYDNFTMLYPVLMRGGLRQCQWYDLSSKG